MNQHISDIHMLKSIYVNPFFFLTILVFFSFRQLDFDLDGEPDCLGLHVAGLGVIVAEESVDNVLRGEYTSPEDYLRSFSRNHVELYNTL